MPVRGSPVLAEIASNRAFRFLQPVLGEQLARLRQSPVGPDGGFLRQRAPDFSLIRASNSPCQDAYAEKAGEKGIPTEAGAAGIGKKSQGQNPGSEPELSYYTWPVRTGCARRPRGARFRTGLDEAAPGYTKTPIDLLLLAATIM